MFDLSGKKALITGASGALGAAIAKQIHRSGASVVVTGTNEEKLEKLTFDLGYNAHALVCDLSDSQKVESLPSRASDILGNVDILINNAGITRDNLLMRMSDQEWNEVLQVNLNSTMKLCRGVLRGMMKTRWGRIINISSIAGVAGNPGQTNYAASKAGIIGMSKSLAYEVASRGITVNVIAPGLIASPMTSKLTEQQKDKILSQIPIGRIGEPGEIAAAALYLASSEAAYTTGATININGGLAML